MNFVNEIMQLHLSKHQEKSITYVIIDYIKWMKLSVLKLIGVKQEEDMREANPYSSQILNQKVVSVHKKEQKSTQGQFESATTAKSMEGEYSLFDLLLIFDKTALNTYTFKIIGQD